MEKVLVEDDSVIVENEEPETLEQIPVELEESEREMIFLNKLEQSENLKTNDILYKYRTEKIKKYAVKEFGILCVFFIGILLFKEKWQKIKK